MTNFETIRAALEDGKSIYTRTPVGEPCEEEIAMYDAALASLAALQEERERMQADSRRLDWLESRGTINIECSVYDTYSIGDQIDEVRFDSLRRAIDAAIGEPAANSQVTVDSSSPDAGPEPIIIADLALNEDAGPVMRIGFVEGDVSFEFHSGTVADASIDLSRDGGEEGKA